MPKLHFRVKVDAIVQGRICPPSAMNSALRAHLADCEDGSVKPGEVTGFYVGAYVGAGNQDICIRPLGTDCTAEVDLKLDHGMVDTCKFTVAFRLKGPQASRCCHLASGFIPTSDLVSMLKSAGRGAAFTADQPCLLFRDNFTPNKVALRFSDVDSDLAAVPSLQLKPSSLRSLEQTNEAVGKLGEYLKSSIVQCAVSPFNLGVQFVDSYTFGHMSNHMTHYALLGYLFRNKATPVDLRMVMYDAYQAMHSTDLGFPALRAMPDSDLALRFGVAAITRHTACKNTMQYHTDYAFNPLGQVCKVKETEDIARTFSAMSMAVQSGLDKSVYPHAGLRCDDVSLARALDELDRAGVTRIGQPGLGAAGSAKAGSKALLVDDCENLADAIIQKGQAILKAYTEAESMAAQRKPRGVTWNLDDSRQARADPVVSALAGMMRREAARSPLFAACTDDHHFQMAEVLCRLGAMLKSKDWDNAFLVASAKSASYVPGTPESVASLSGHGAGISRVRDAKTGQFLHAALEGTTYAVVDRPAPAGYPSQLPIKIMGQNGGPDSVEAMRLSCVATAVAQNVAQYVSLSSNFGALAHFESKYEEDPDECPFYVSAFYTGLSEGPHGSIACIPVDTCPPARYLAGEKPLFGAPVMGLSSPSTMAMPITAETFKAAGVEDPEGVLKLMAAQVEEAWGPPMSREQADSIASYWQPVQSPDKPKLGAENYAAHIRTENTWAYEDPRHAALGVRVCSGLADRFNDIQARDPASDGSRAAAFGQYLSATLRVTIPIPKKTQGFSLSTMRNMRKAADDIGLHKLAGCPVKAKMMQARAKVPSDHLFYMCDKGEGPVHAFNKILA